MTDETKSYEAPPKPLATFEEIAEMDQDVRAVLSTLTKAALALANAAAPVKPQGHDAVRLHGLICGLQLFSVEGSENVSALHDVLLAGGSLALNEENTELVTGWGWHWDDNNDCWGFFT